MQSEQNPTTMSQQNSSISAVDLDGVLELNTDMETSGNQHSPMPRRLHSRRLLSYVVSAIVPCTSWNIDNYGFI